MKSCTYGSVLKIKQKIGCELPAEQCFGCRNDKLVVVPMLGDGIGWKSHRQRNHFHPLLGRENCAKVIAMQRFRLSRHGPALDSERIASSPTPVERHKPFL